MSTYECTKSTTTSLKCVNSLGENLTIPKRCRANLNNLYRNKAEEEGRKEERRGEDEIREGKEIRKEETINPCTRREVANKKERRRKM